MKEPEVNLSGINDLLLESGGRFQVPESLNANDQRLQDILDNTPAVVFVKDLELRYLLVNREYERRHQVQRNQIRGKTDFDILPLEVAETVRANDRHVIEAGTSIQFEETVPTTEGERRYVVAKFLLRDSAARPYAVCGIATDITELKRAEELQHWRARQALLRADVQAAFTSGPKGSLPAILQRSAEAVIRHLDGAGAGIWTVNDCEEVLELQASAGLSLHLEGEHQKVDVGSFGIGLVAKERKLLFSDEVQHDASFGYSEWARREGLVAFAGYPLLVEGRLIGVLALFRRHPLGQNAREALEMVAYNIAQGIERQRAGKKVDGLNRTLQTLYQCDQALVRATEEYDLLQSVCRILVEIGGLRMAWVGYREFDEEKRIRPVAQAGYEAGYLEGINVTWEDSERGRGPMGTAIRTGNTSWNRDILTDPKMGPWRTEALKRRYASSISLPLMGQGEAFGALALYAAEADAFTESAIEQYTDLANNLAYGVIALRTREERQRAEREIRQLNASLEKRVIERTIELVHSNEQLKRAEEQFRKHGEQVQIHRDVLLELACSDKSDLTKALQKICSLSAGTLEVARVSYWSLEEDNSAIISQILYRGDMERCDDEFKGTRLGNSDCPAYFEALATRRPIVANRVLKHPATSGLPESYLKALNISSMLDAPVWVSGKVVGVLCHEHTGLPRNWTSEEVDFVTAVASMVSLALEESNRARSENLLRESEEKFRALFEGTSQAVVLHDEKGILEANLSWLRLLGYSNLKEVIGMHPSEVSAPVQPSGERADELAKKHIATALATGSARFDWVVLRTDGTEVPIEVFLTPMQLGGRRLIQAVCNDITQRKQAEAELLRALAREKELGQLRSKFVSVVSHEFRTPLAIIQSSAEILDDYLGQLVKAERKDHLQSIRKNTRRMAALMEETLLIGSFDAGKMEFKPTPLELKPLLNRLVDEVLSATNQRCPISFLFSGRPKVESDERLLRHIFTNLLTNAVKYSDPGRLVQFEVFSGPSIICSIRDQGIGIPEADREWLFDAFHRGLNVGDRPGTGLGLVIVKRCVDLHGGKIKVESNLGEGTLVTLSLPLS